ncbi:Bacterial alpha-L-rhamnosidase [Planctomycetes bacterium MalM25]|nr:Bacterial alpha-L-rhamnosidase [Planctomycetes bacterium MalM25]
MAISSQPDGDLLIDFGRVAFGNIEFTPPEGCEGEVVVRFGEKLSDDGSIDRDPPGTVRFSEVAIKAKPGERVIVAPPADERNTQEGNRQGRYGNTAPPAVLTPPEWGVLTPFRWVEIEGVTDDLCVGHISRRAAFPRGWDDNAASFACSDETLNQVWELCHYSIKATLFSGIYVDGDRERIPYEADAYLNQLSDYYTSGDPAAARRTFEWLMEYPTWPSEWAPHMVFMAHADWMHFGDIDWLTRQYEGLKSKTLIERCNDTALVQSSQRQIEWNDIVDWPPQERDGHVQSEVNTVVNAFHLAAVTKMVELAEVVGAHSDAVKYAKHADRAKEAFNSQLFDAERGLYRDGRNVDHNSLHASFFPLAFGLVDEEHRESVTDWLINRGMQCSVYASQYLLEALFENGAGEAAVEMMIAPGDRSWRHMLDSDATITWEAWNVEAKANLDWNHAWGAAPANLLPRYVLGVQPLSPGWDRAIIRPHTSGLEFARGVTPTQHGPIRIDWRNSDDFKMRVELPEGVSAEVHVPSVPNAISVFVNNHQVEAVLEGGYWKLVEELAGNSVIEVR